MELLAKSCFSFLRGSSGPEQMILRAAELGHQSIALVDHMGFYGSARAHTTAKKLGIHAIVGATLENIACFKNISIICKSRTGYQNLSRLLTQLHCFPDTTDFNTTDLSGLHAILTSESLHNPRKAELLSAAEGLKKHFGHGNVSIAIHRHLRRGEERRNQLLADLASHTQLPLLASNASLYAERHNRLMADAFTCLREKHTLDDAGTLLEMNSERFLKSPAELARLFKKYPESVQHAYDLSGQCDFSLENLGYKFPSYRDPSSGRLLSNEEQNKLLHQLAYEGIHDYVKNPGANYYEQLKKELYTITKLNFAGYFLIVWDIVRFARSQGILCQGRGSAANSLVCFVLGITAIDPVDSRLLFERFLSENRTSWPDIDVDFPSGERREAVIQYIYKKYAPHGAAMTANVITYKPRSAFREMSKILGFPESIANRFTDLCTSPKVHDVTKDHYTEGYSEEVSMSNYYPSDKVLEFSDTVVKSGIPQEHPRFEPLIQLYHAALSCPRHLGQHSGGMVFCDGGLDHIVPLEPATMPGRTVLQWDKDDCEDLGIVKVDILGLGMLAAMEDTLKLCERRGKSVNLSLISKHDKPTYDLLCAADTIGTFQVESRAQMATLPVMQPKEFYDMAIEVALIRPGPIVGDLVHPYLNRRQGLEKVTYVHPLFEPILERTLGVPLFQEQVLQMSMVIADFDGVEADTLRKAMAFKRDDSRMTEIVQKLKDRMRKKGIPEEIQNQVIHSIGSFALYGFPESHAISFGLIAYMSCWLKVHCTVEFYCGLINNQPMGFYSVNTLLQDAKRHGIKAKPVSVCHSLDETDVLDDHTIRIGLHKLKGLRQKMIDRLLEVRSLIQFESLEDFLRRVQPNVKERRILALSGALNDLPKISHRRSALWQAEQLPPDDLFAQLQPKEEEHVLPQMNEHERLQNDFAIQGHGNGAHPIRFWRKREAEAAKNLATSQTFHHLPHSHELSIAGMVICRQRPGTAKGHCFISLEDEWGIANLFIPKETYHEYRTVITSESFLKANGRLQIAEGRQPTMFVTHLQPLNAAPALTTSSHDFH